MEGRFIEAFRAAISRLVRARVDCDMVDWFKGVESDGDGESDGEEGLVLLVVVVFVASFAMITVGIVTAGGEREMELRLGFLVDDLG